MRNGTRPGCDKPDPFENEKKYPGVKFGARGKNMPVWSFYGKATGIVGLRLFPNPAFDEAAEKKWLAAIKEKPDAYYTDPNFYNTKHLVRPYRVGMSCGFCHVGPAPTQRARRSGKSAMGQPEFQSGRAIFLGRPHLHLESDRT